MLNENLHSKFTSIVAKKNAIKFKQKTRDEKHEYVKFMSTLNYCLNSLSDDYREIIEESYFKSNFKFWWVDKYCKSSFYRKREKAICSFVQLFVLIYENYVHFSYNVSNAIH